MSRDNFLSLGLFKRWFLLVHIVIQIKSHLPPQSFVKWVQDLLLVRIYPSRFLQEQVKKKGYAFFPPPSPNVSPLWIYVDAQDKNSRILWISVFFKSPHRRRTRRHNALLQTAKNNIVSCCASPQTPQSNNPRLPSIMSATTMYPSSRKKTEKKPINPAKKHKLCRCSWPDCTCLSKNSATPHKQSTQR